MKQWILDPARGARHYDEGCQRFHRIFDLGSVDRVSPCSRESTY